MTNLARPVVALAGNPNTGKSTVFNALTGLNQHTGNWPGKTVTLATGSFAWQNTAYTIVDLPGTYSLFANSPEEEVARDFILFEAPDVTVVVVDATCLERNLNLVLQILELTPKTVVCVNLMDEARRQGLAIDTDRLAAELGVPCIPSVARSGEGIAALKTAIRDIGNRHSIRSPRFVRYGTDIEASLAVITAELAPLASQFSPRWLALRILERDNSLLQRLLDQEQEQTPATAPCSCPGHKEGGSMARLNPNQAAALQQASQLAADLPTPSHDQLVHSIYDTAQTIAELVVKIESGPKITWQERLDRVLTSPWLGFPVMITLLVIVFWLTFEGANHPSEMLSALFHVGEDFLSALFITMNAPTWLHGLLVLGIYRSTAWVVSVMLPPMAIFFPLFTLLEDLGYLPRVAFNLDRFFQWAGAHGKQALTMSMGFGCNAAGVIACRIIDSPRERLVAILTNTFVPCNGRFPTFIALSSIFLGSTLYGVDSGFLASFAVLSLILVGIGTTLGVSWLLTRTLLRGVPSAFVLELPPYRPPQVGRILVRSVLDRTIHVLMRAIVWAAPAGAVTWILANTPLGSETMLSIAAGHLDKFARCLGLDGVILLAFFLGLPANEIVLPIVVMGYLAEGALLWPDSLSELQQLLVAHGWTAKTAILVMLFSLLHFPCSTTLWTIKKETGSKLWTAVAFFLPLTLACTVLFLLNLLLPSL